MGYKLGVPYSYSIGCRLRQKMTNIVEIKLNEWYNYLYEIGSILFVNFKFERYNKDYNKTNGRGTYVFNN